MREEAGRGRWRSRNDGMEMEGTEFATVSQWSGPVLDGRAELNWRCWQGPGGGKEISRPRDLTQRMTQLMPES